MAALDLFVYHDFTDTTDQLLKVGDSAEEKLGDSFEGLYVVAPGPPIHEGRSRTVVLAHEARPEMMQDLKFYFSHSHERP